MGWGETDIGFKVPIFLPKPTEWTPTKSTPYHLMSVIVSSDMLGHVLTDRTPWVQMDLSIPSMNKGSPIPNQETATYNNHAYTSKPKSHNKKVDNDTEQIIHLVFKK